MMGHTLIKYKEDIIHLIKMIDSFDVEPEDECDAHDLYEEFRSYIPDILRSLEFACRYLDLND